MPPANVTAKGIYAEERLPPVRERMCVTSGTRMAEARGTNAIVYRWHVIAKFWRAWPSTSLRDFCRVWQISYRAAVQQPIMRVRDKPADAALISQSYREAMLSVLTVKAMVNGEELGRRMREVLDKTQLGSELGVSYALSKMAKVQPDGSMTPNLTLTTAEVHKCMEIFRSASESIQGCATLPMCRPRGSSASSGMPSAAPRASMGFSRAACAISMSDCMELPADAVCRAW